MIRRLAWRCEIAMDAARPIGREVVRHVAKGSTPRKPAPSQFLSASSRTVLREERAQCSSFSPRDPLPQSDEGTPRSERALRNCCCVVLQKMSGCRGRGRDMDRPRPPAFLQSSSGRWPPSPGEQGEKASTTPLSAHARCQHVSQWASRPRPAASPGLHTRPGTNLNRIDSRQNMMP